MKRLFLSLACLAAIGLAGCPKSGSSGSSSAPGPSSGNATGAPSARAALDAFLDAIKAQDIQRTSEVWGTQKGPARDQMSRDYLEKAVVSMQCFLKHDSYRVLNDLPGDQGRRQFRVELTSGRVVRQTSFWTIPGPRERWYVERADLDPVKDLCKQG